MKKKPCRFCQSVRGTVKRALGRKTMAERTEEARDASAQRQPLPQRARASEGQTLLSISTPKGPVVVRGSRQAVGYVGSVLRKVSMPTL